MKVQTWCIHFGHKGGIGRISDHGRRVCQQVNMFGLSEMNNNNMKKKIKIKKNVPGPAQIKGVGGISISN